MSDQGVPGSALGRPSINGEGRAVQLEDLLPTGRRSFDSGGEALIQLCATTRLGTVSPGEATGPPQVPPRYRGCTMTLTLDDVRNKRFRVARKSGYDILEVDEFVDEVEESFAQLLKDN